MVTGSDSRFSFEQLACLPWRRLAQACTDPLVAPHLRKRAEMRLAARVETLALGEKVALARIAPQGLLLSLALLREPAVFDALLGNPRMTTDILLSALGDPEIPPEALKMAAGHHRWAVLPAVRTLVVTHRSTPVHTALKVLAGLPETEVRRLQEEGSLPPVLAIHAARLQQCKTERVQ